MMNLLMLSVGRRVEIVKYFKKEIHKINGKVITVDINEYAPALYEGDEWVIVSKDFSDLEDYINTILQLCISKNIQFVISLIDPELQLLAQYRSVFQSHGIEVIVSDGSIITETFDKLNFYDKYNKILPLVKTYASYSEIADDLATGGLTFPIIVKDRFGSGSSGFKIINDNVEFSLYKHHSNVIFQKCIIGKEFGVDVYFDLLTRKIVSVFIKEKVGMRAGETDKAISVWQKDIYNEIIKLQKIDGFYGPIDVDVFVNSEGEIFINEINPRFGGGYPHAYNCGVNFMDKIVNNMQGQVNKDDIGTYPEGIVMMKYNGLLFKEGNKIYS